MKKRIIFGIIVTILLVLILFISYNSEPTLLKPSLNEIPLNYQDLEIQEPNYSISDDEINKNLLVQKWTFLSEISGTNPEPYTESDYQITFNSDNTFTSTTFGIPEQGIYEVSKNKIILKDKQGVELQTYAEVSEDNLAILIPTFPRKITYKRN